VLVPIVFLCGLLLTLGTALLESSLAAARTSLQATVARYSEAAIGNGVAEFSAGLASFVETRGTSGPWPSQLSRSPSRALCAAPAAPTACPFAYTVTATIVAASAGPTAATAFAGTATSGSEESAANLQTAAIGEQRVSAIVTATITNANGTILGQRARRLTYRVFAAPPYAVVVGARDAAAVDQARTSAPGDTGGVDGGASTARDTRIHVQLTCRTVTPDVVPFANDQQPAGNDGLPWGDTAGAAYEAPCPQTASPADAFVDARWASGDADSGGWAQ
jgi:hypothetical protein